MRHVITGDIDCQRAAVPVSGRFGLGVVVEKPSVAVRQDCNDGDFGHVYQRDSVERSAE